MGSVGVDGAQKMIRKIKTDDKDRIETGALQVNDDWTGLFIRGDDCVTLLDILENRSFTDLNANTLSHKLEASIKRDVFHKRKK
jgi:hypothetical protein